MGQLRLGRRLALVGLIVAAACAYSCAQNYTTITATNIADLTGAKLASGQLCFTATDAAGHQINFQVGGGGQVITGPTCWAITNGAISGAQVANPSNTDPEGVLYHIVATNATGQVVLDYRGVQLSGSTWSLDSYFPGGTVSIPVSLPLSPSNGGTGLATVGANGTFLESNGTSLLFAVPPTSPVASVFGRTGAVVAATGDYSFSQLSGSLSNPQLPNPAAFSGTVSLPYPATSAIGLLTGIASNCGSNVGAVAICAPSASALWPLIFSIGGTRLLGVDDTGTLVASGVTDSALTAGNCVQAGTGGALGSASGPCLITIPAPTATTLGGVKSAAAPANQFVTGIDTTGALTFAQPSFANVSGLLADAQLPADAAKFTGAITANHCADWSSSGVLTDAGAPCGTGGSSVWSALTSPTASLGLSMGADTSTFTFGSALSNAFAWLNGTAATSGANQSSPSLEIGGYGWIGGTPASTLDAWTLQDALGTGTNPSSTFTLGHTGTTGALNVLLPAGVTLESGDTGAPGITFGANSLTINQPLTVSGATTGLGGAPGTAPTAASGKNYLANVTAGWEESLNGGAYSLLMTNPFTTLGDVLYGGASGAPTRLGGNTTTSAECLQETGTGSAAQAPTWAACGSGSGTVNSGTQYQLGYYATTSSTISGDANLVTDASNNLSAAGKLTAGATAASTLCDGGTGGCVGATEGTAPTDATAGADRLYADSTCHCIKGEYNSTTAYAIPQTIATGTATLATAAISAGTCATAVTVAATGVATTDTIAWSFNAAPGTGYTAGLDIKPYVTAGNANFLVCNPTAGSLTPAAATLNWAVRR